MANSRRPAHLIARNATLADIAAIMDLTERAYNGMPAYTSGMIRGQINSFPEGQFVVEYDGAVVGYAATFIIAESVAFAPHTWDEISGKGYAARHDPNGDWLYGMEVCVDPSRRRLRIGQRLYDARKGVAEQMNLKGIVFGGRMPNYAKRRKQFPDPDVYVTAVHDGEQRDPVLEFQMRAGFEPQGVLPKYNPSDKESGGNAVLMRWQNPYAGEEIDSQPVSRRNTDTVRVATVQMQARAVSDFDEFMRNCEYFVDVCSDYRADFVVFPELFTLQLLALTDQRLPPDRAIEELTKYTAPFVERMSALSVSYNINIIGGSHPTITDDGDIQNVAYVFLRDGSVHAQEKIHPTPDEKYWWNIKGGDTIGAIETDCGPIAVLICYDSEFPELARRVVDEGARILFVPFCTNNRQGYLRVRYCSQARAVENQCYVVMSGNVGNLPNVENMDVQYAQSCILTPSDMPFARDGIAAEASENVETIAVADLNLSDLSYARAQGAVRNLRDRRFDMYQVVFSDGG